MTRLRRSLLQPAIRVSGGLAAREDQHHSFASNPQALTNGRLPECSWYVLDDVYAHNGVKGRAPDGKLDCRTHDVRRAGTHGWHHIEADPGGLPGPATEPVLAPAADLEDLAAEQGSDLAVAQELVGRGEDLPGNGVEGAPSDLGSNPTNRHCQAAPRLACSEASAGARARYQNPMAPSVSLAVVPIMNSPKAQAANRATSSGKNRWLSA